jgi:hypothetical protein
MRLERGTSSELLVQAKWFVAILTSYKKLHSTKIRWFMGTDRDFFFLCILCFQFCQLVNLKCTLVQALRLCTGCMAHRGSSGIALLFHGQWH